MLLRAFSRLLLCWTSRTALLLLLAAFQLPCQGQTAPLVLSAAPEEIQLAPYVDYFCDASGKLDLAAVQQRNLQHNESYSLSLGYQDGACWFRYTLENRSAIALNLILLINSPLLEDIQFFAPGSSLSYWHTGDRLGFNSRPVATRNFTFPFSLPAHSRQEYFLRVSTNSSMSVPLRLMDNSRFIGAIGYTEWLHGLTYGLTLGLLVFHLFLWVAAREPIYRYYVLYLASAFSYLLCLQGFAYRLWPNAPIWNGQAFIAFQLLTLLTGLLFTRDFLNIDQRWPLGNRLLLGMSALLLGSIVMLFLLPTGLMLRLHLHPALAILSIACSLFVGLRQWRRGLKEARLYVMAWSLLLVMGLAYSIQAYGVLIPLPSFVFVNGLEIGFVLQQSLLALGLASRLKTLKKEKQRQEEEVLRAHAESAAKTEFLARMSHEIRTPMNAMMGITQLLQDTNLDNAQKNYVDMLFSSGHSLLHVINDILDYSKIVAGKVELVPADFNLLDLLDECVQAFHLNARSKSLSLVCERSRDLPTYVRGDIGRLRQILLNLLSNAIKFTDSGNVSLRASVEEMSDSRVRLRFEVEDNGIGIPEEKLPQLFESFVQADATTSRQYGGTGLGLAISRQLVELMHGKITVSSKPGQGTLFRFSVLLKIVPAETLRVQATDVAHIPATFDGMHALVVEDNPINQLVIQGFLQKLNITAHMASGGQEALDILQQGNMTFDVIFMDCEMPFMDGFEATRRLRQWEKQKDLKPHIIVALTAHALPEHRTRCLAVGMDDYLSKPLMLPRLVEKLHSLLDVRDQALSRSAP